MLHARPTSHKLTVKSLVKMRKDAFDNHLKKVVEPPEPYSSTSMSGFKTEQINSTPHLSNITVLRQRIGNEIHKTNTGGEILSPSHGWFKGEGEIVLIETPLPYIFFSLPIWICTPLPTQQIFPHPVHFRSVEWQWLDHGNAISMLVCDLNNEVGQKTRQLTWHWWCWLEAAKWLKWWKPPLQELIQQLSPRCPPMLKTPSQIMIEMQSTMNVQ